MEEEKKGSNLFREKSLETIESPESLNDYLRVTSPGVWLVLATVIVLLVGGILWSVLGRINTSGTFAVEATAEECVCYVSFDTLEELETVLKQGVVTIDGQDYPLKTDIGLNREDIISITEDINPRVRVAGKLEIGDFAVKLPVDAQLPVGVYSGTIVTESLQPFSLLLK